MSHLKKNTTKRSKVNDFSKIGGLSNHLQILRETIIVPLLHSNIYNHFKIKSPRGILFYGPPGTGKTLVAGALATELSCGGIKVTFFQRKGGDILDKWVGESEKKLRLLFETASKSRPSIIFFDEIDGLAPMRSAKNDHVHCSIVSTLLALMDGLDSVPGLIIIGATNRIEALDPALRRPGRFDRELFFPLPSGKARKEILQVHTSSWKNKPRDEFLSYLADITTGFCGADIQALCAETLLCSMKRLFPDIQNCVLGTRVKIEADEIKIEEDDFLTARRQIIPAALKLGNKMRRLSPVVAPLLQDQLDIILRKLKMLWPHFSKQFYSYLVGTERYIGRVILNGSNLQGTNTHIVPAILQNYEHLPAYFLDIANLQTGHFLAFRHNLPSILVIPRIDELWNFLEIFEQNYVASILEDVHAGLPILIIASCDGEMPVLLQNFFYNNTSLTFNIENPTEQQVAEFFGPLFFNEANEHSLAHVLTENKSSAGRSNRRNRTKNNSFDSFDPSKINPNSGRVLKKSRERRPNVSRNSTEIVPLTSKRTIMNLENPADTIYTCEEDEQKIKRFSMVLTELLMKSLSYITGRKPRIGHHVHRVTAFQQPFKETDDSDKQQVYNLWLRACETGRSMCLANLEVLFDTISACVSIHKDNFANLVENLKQTLEKI